MADEQTNVRWRINDMHDIEDCIEYVPLGIDDRSNPAIARSAKQLRIERGLTSQDLMIGHFGLIIDDLKKLGAAVDGFISFASELRDSDDKRSLLFVLVGKVIDQEFFQSIRDRFEASGLKNSFVHQMPNTESDFDVEIAACDAIFCMRRQQRGQLSHVFVRALSLGLPVLVNRDSGYSYDPMTTLDDDNLNSSIVEVLWRTLDWEGRRMMRQRARAHYEAFHRGEKSLELILKEQHDDSLQ
jgi:hypothetical protein